nr:uncharacterized protein LOC109155859 [Ipomoea batatas]
MTRDGGPAASAMEIMDESAVTTNAVSQTMNTIEEVPETAVEVQKDMHRKDPESASEEVVPETPNATLTTQSPDTTTSVPMNVNGADKPRSYPDMVVVRCNAKNLTNNSSTKQESVPENNVLLKAAWYSSKLLASLIPFSGLRPPQKLKLQKELQSFPPMDGLEWLMDL